MAGLNNTRRATVLSCPKCAAMLYEVHQDDDLRFYCERQHGFRPEEICPGIADSLEDLLPDVVGALTR